tara:strand:+ start:24622 stop:25128 length:507 start_codon:yes stop_codon:yes gene_type:complete
VADKRELLAMLTIHGVQIGKAVGGVPAITQMDIAVMLRKCTPAQEALLRAKYVGEGYQTAKDYWFEIICSQEFETRRPGILEDMCEATLDEHLSNEICQQCGGTNVIIQDNKPTDCDHCHGGRVAWSNREMARRLGLSRLKEPWINRIQWCRVALAAWESEAVSKLTY